MNTFMRHRQTGATLLIAMIMLVVLTLLVVFSIRSGNTNLRIAGNMQAETEANAATESAIEQVIEQIKIIDDISTIQSQNIVIATGSTSHTVKVEPMNNCIFDAPVLPAELKDDNAADRACLGTEDPSGIIGPGGLVPKIPSCKKQQWDIQAGVTDNITGVQVNQVQGILLRVGAETKCL